MTISRRLIDPASCLRLVTAENLLEGSIIVLGWTRYAAEGHDLGDPVVKARPVIFKRWAADPPGSYEIRWEGDEHDWVICKPSALFVVCEAPA